MLDSSEKADLEQEAAFVQQRRQENSKASEAADRLLTNQQTPKDTTAFILTRPLNLDLLHRVITHGTNNQKTQK
jgi:hypothetical protein